MTENQVTPSVAKAAIWMTGTLVSFMLMAVAVRELHEANIHTFEMLLIRSIIGIVVVVAVAWHLGFHVLRTSQPKLQIGRNIVHYGGQATWVYGLSLLPLAEVFALEFTVPIWVAIFAIVFLGERINRGRLIAIILGFLGVLVILKPGVDIIDPGAFVVLACAIFFGGAITCTKKLVQTDTPLAVLFFMVMIQTPLGLVPTLFLWVTPEWHDVPWLIVLGLTGLSAHFCEAHAFRYADATVVIPLQFLRLPLIAIIGFIFYEEGLELVAFFGAALIFSGNYYNIRLEHRRERRA
jgi:drug/metabolite transporter (DMT)-like permease